MDNKIIKIFIFSLLVCVFYYATNITTARGVLQPLDSSVRPNISGSVGTGVIQKDSGAQSSSSNLFEKIFSGSSGEVSPTNSQLVVEGENIKASHALDLNWFKIFCLAAIAAIVAVIIYVIRKSKCS